ncbi:TD and POZ domain-containing protein 1 [Caerostris extrusa]|uniref:TD and POZ domain-containing protein 1 n=1 Tax=Caerostris extrusa TaxID=172846 RepID=A0AAV4XKZ3_CAEEX|nr:TD and POZ domain-containing protein 1 [Caerostris extrusa]
MNLKRNLKCAGPDNITLNVDMALLLMDGSVLHQELSEKSITFQKCQYHAINTCLLREEILDVIRNKLLPEDSLKVQCRIWRADGETMEEETFFARTVVEIERKSFIWDIHYFSPDRNPSFILCFPSNIVMKLNLLFEENCKLDDDKIRVRITSSDQNLKSFTFQCELLEASGNELVCGRQEFWPDDLQEGGMYTLPYARQELMGNKKYLPNGALSLKCDCVIAMGIGYNKIESVSSGFSPLIRHPYSVNESKPDTEENELDTSSDLKDDLKTLYSESALSDMKILTSTETFLAHTQILAARSPVFRAMFSTDMKERTKECVDIPDLDSNTMRQFLLYMYTDTLEDLQCESAQALYAEADKYAVLSLKNSCSSFLKKSLSATSACDILVLADMHGDDDLKRATQDYILQLGKDILLSSEWKLLMKSNPQLALETVYRNWDKT